MDRMDRKNQPFLLMTSLVDLPLDRESVQASEWETNKEADAMIQHEEGIVKCSLNLPFSTLRRSGSGTPQCAVSG